MGSQMRRGVYPERSEWAQHDNTGFGRSSSSSALRQYIVRLRGIPDGACSAILLKKRKKHLLIESEGIS